MSQAAVKEVFADGFHSLLQRLRDETHPLSFSALRFAEEFEYQTQDLARLAHVHRNTVRINPTSSELQAYIKNALRVVKAAEHVSGDLGTAKFWFKNNPIEDLRYKTADELVSEGKTEAVLKYLELLEDGASG